MTSGSGDRGHGRTNLEQRHRERERRLELANAQALSPRTGRYWAELWLYVWIVALLGAWWEALLSFVLTNLTGDRAWSRPVGPETILSFAEPYGIGAAAVILVVIPLYRRQRLTTWQLFLVSGLLCAFVEAVCALVLIAVLGSNPFWDFSNYPFNLMGMTSPISMIVFGLVGTGFVRYAYPRTELPLRRWSKRKLAVAIVVTLVLYLIATVRKLMTLGVTF